MDKNISAVREKQIERVITALEKNNMKAYYVHTKEEAVKQVEALLKIGEAIACGGSMTLKESGVRDLMNNGFYDFIDREAGKIPKPEADHKAFTCHTYITSTNALTENGELYNVDGNGNRLAALIYGPEKVIVVAGYNKIVKNITEAVYRVKTVAAPANALRLDKNTPCARSGRCAATNKKDMTEGCRTPESICAQYLVTGRQQKDRISVIIVGEELGY